ncbi:MAG: c-type cytochrome [Gammaproteobacteria bacterium]|nr:c-type cytochrome [Gammaproteobacteria bacterium]
MAPMGEAAADPSIERLIASQCAQCHGTDGRSVGDIQKLAGEETYEKLMEMLFELRAENIMEHQAQGYTPEQLRNIANYYQNLPERARNGGGGQ